jgi:resuscitation-promoting factor RpfB
MKRGLEVLAVSGVLLLGACRPDSVAPPDAMPTPTPSSASPGRTPKATPAVERRTVTQKRSIGFPTRKVRDPRLPAGTTKVTRRGVVGVLTLTYEVTLTDGRQTGKRLVRRVVTRAPVARVVAVGTRAVRRCDSDYSGCVPIASDVDCAGGGGNGPAYVEGTVRVIGTDVYDLDRDGDGIGCD